MISQDLIREVASHISNRLAAGEARSTLALSQQKCLIIFAGGDVNLLTALQQIRASQPNGDCRGLRAIFAASGEHPVDRQMALRELPGIEEVAGEMMREPHHLLAATTQVIIPAMTLGLASKIAALQLDSPFSDIAIHALMQGKRVIAVTDSIFCCQQADSPSRPPAGLARAIEELKMKLQSLGIELTTAAELGELLQRKPAAFVTLSHRPQALHPSQEKFDTPEAVNEFVEFLERKRCEIEPDKPCIGRGICRARGF